MRVFQNRSYCTIMNRSQAFFSQRVRVSSSAHWMPVMNRFHSLPEAQSLPQTKHSLRTARTRRSIQQRRRVLEQLTGFALTRGMLCAMHRRPLSTMEEICRNARRVAILENVVNPTNVGAIFRSAAALGIDAVFLTSGCSNPLYRRAIRVSMGNVFQVPWTVLPGGSYWPEQGIAALQELGFYTVAMALKEDSVPMDDPSLKTHEKLAILLGTEGDGLASDTIAETDATVLIPMTHGVDSLNVAAASAVAFWELAGRR